jgi:methylmalonyl-CoA epimerase
MELPIDVIGFDHVAQATWDLTAQADLLTRVLGARFFEGGDDRLAGYRWLQFTLPGGNIELLEPLHDQGFLYKFLTRRGEGLHHVTLKVRDLTAAIPSLREAGYEPVDVNLAHESWKEAFLHPKDTSGVLIQLAQTPERQDEGGRGRTLEEYLADRPGLRPA